MYHPCACAANKAKQNLVQAVETIIAVEETRLPSALFNKKKKNCIMTETHEQSVGNVDACALTYA